MQEAEIGGRIRDLRVQSRLTAEELAGRAGLSPSAWSRIEHGDRSVKSSELSRIAAALGVSPLAILDGDSLLTQLPLAARAIDGGTVEGSSVIRRLTALTELDDVLRKGGIRGRPNLGDLPETVSDAWLAQADSTAAWARHSFDEWSHRATADAPFDRLALFIQSHLRVDLVVEHHPSDPLLGAAITDASFPLIFVNATHPVQRCMFTLAHELGHILSHNGTLLALDRDLNAKSPHERSANAFAAAFLMPRDRVDSNLKEHGRGAESLANMLIEFGVSFESLVYRLQNLGMIDSSGRDQLRRVGFSGLLAEIGENPGLQARLLSARSASVATTPPLPLTARVARGWATGVVSIRPLAALLGEDPDELLASFERAGTINNDYSGSPEVPEELYVGSPI